MITNQAEALAYFRQRDQEREQAIANQLIKQVEAEKNYQKPAVYRLSDDDYPAIILLSQYVNVGRVWR